MNPQTKISPLKPKANEWFLSGERMLFDLVENVIGTKAESSPNRDQLHVWNKTVNKPLTNDIQWTTMMPGFPDGSFGWAATEHYLSHSYHSPRLYVEYVGMGDSDKPNDYKYSVMERADMIEALWEHHTIKSTVLVTFDFSSLVALELLSRQIELEKKGKTPFTKIRKVLFINGGLFADSHSHPIMTTPLLKTAFGKAGAKMAQRSGFLFNMMMKDLWSKKYAVTKEELAQIHEAIGNRNGTVFMSNAAGFVDEHKQNAARWDLERIFQATFPQVSYIVAGSAQDQFEPRQVLKARALLEKHGLAIVMYPGGHMTTSEHPDLIADTIKTLAAL